MLSNNAQAFFENINRLTTGVIGSSLPHILIFFSIALFCGYIPIKKVIEKQPNSGFYAAVSFFGGLAIASSLRLLTWSNEMLYNNATTSQALSIFSNGGVGGGYDIVFIALGNVVNLIGIIVFIVGLFKFFNAVVNQQKYDKGEIASLLLAGILLINIFSVLDFFRKAFILDTII